MWTKSVDFEAHIQIVIILILHKLLVHGTL